MNLRNLLLATGIAVVTVPVSVRKAPEPYGLTLGTRQVERYNREMITLFHFGISTFEEYVNEDDGRAPAVTFDPTALDRGQWMRTLRSAGIPSVIITAKRADGSHLWLSKHTDCGVKNSAWKGGKGDAIHESVDACEEYDIKAGTYLRPYDRYGHLSPLYTTEKYRQYYGHQLEELIGDYGKAWGIWWDGIGTDELTTLACTHWYKIVREKQPDCVIFGTKNSHSFADMRWVGNESGKADDPCWSATGSVCIKDERKDYEGLNEGVKGGDAYISAETDVSIYPSWSYHAEEDSRVKSVKELWDIYCTPVRHNSVPLLNFPLDHRGLTHPTGLLHAALLKQGLDETFGNNLLAKAKVETASGREGRFRPEFLTNSNKEIYFADRDGAETSDVIFIPPQQTEFDRLIIREVIELGHRTTKWSVEHSNDSRSWTPIPEATDKQTVGYEWIVRFELVKAKQVCPRILDRFICPAIHTFGVCKQSALLQ